VSLGQNACTLGGSSKRDDGSPFAKACGKTRVRNVTASGNWQVIDPKEPFDVNALCRLRTFQYFWEILFAREMGESSKMAFSFFWLKDKCIEVTSMIWDFIPKLKRKIRWIKQVRCFKVLLVEAWDRSPENIADAVISFLEVDQAWFHYRKLSFEFWPTWERCSERNKSRMKFLVKDLGLDYFSRFSRAGEKGPSIFKYPIQTEELRSQTASSNPEKPRFG